MKKISLLIFALALGIGLFAQNNEEVTIEGTYRPKVNKVNKILPQPETPQQTFEIPSAEVQIRDVDRFFPLELDKVSSINYNGKNSQTAEVAKNFLMAGFGSRVSPLFLYKHNSNLRKTLGLGVGIEHYSSWLGMKDYGPSSFMNNAFEIGLTSNRYRSFQLGGNVYYTNDLYHYYGFHPLPSDNVANLSANTRQTYNTIGTHFGLASTTTRNGEFVHDLGLDYHYMFDLFGVNEHFVGLHYDLGYVENWWGKKNNPQKAGAVLDFQYDRFVGSRLLAKFNPYLEMKDEFFRLHLGFLMDYTDANDGSRFALGFYPDLKGSLFVLDKKVEFYAGLNGGRRLNTFEQIVAENPFVARKFDLTPTAVKLGFDGGVRTNVMETMDLHLGVRYRHSNHELFFQPCPNPTMSDLNQAEAAFAAITDETQSVSVLADIRWLAMDKLTMDAGFAYNNYIMTNELHPWYRPALEGNLKLNYRIDDNWNLNTSFLYQGGRWAQENTYPVKLKDVFDLGLGADYRVNDKMAVFAKINNVLHQKYQLYYNYPVNGIEFFAGLKMTF